MTRFPMVLVLAAAPSLALEQLAHRDVTNEACLAAGQPALFCSAIASASMNVDAEEWAVPAAHAQADDGGDRCDGARKTVSRVYDLSTALSREADGLTVAKTFGRILHTLQDECAHHGMPNVQHAWFSAMDTCMGTRASPDLDPDALTCAKDVTRRAFDTLKTRTPEDLAVSTSRQLPTDAELCAYLKSANTWDGVDRRWNAETMAVALEDALARGMRGMAVAEVSCAALDRTPSPAVDTSKGMACAATSATCAPSCGCDQAPAGLVALFAVARWRSRRRR